TSMDDLLTVGQKLMTAHSSDPNFSALYFPGKYWYAALPFVWDFGGNIATQSGDKWQGSLNADGSQQGLVKLQNLVNALSRADKTGDEAKQDAAFAQGGMATVGRAIPNATSLLGLGTGQHQVCFGAAKNSRFVPNSKNWASVENANVLPDMLVKIFTKQQTIPEATGSASSRITSILNGGG